MEQFDHRFCPIQDTLGFLAGLTTLSLVESYEKTLIRAFCAATALSGTHGSWTRADDVYPSYRTFIEGDDYVEVHVEEVAAHKWFWACFLCCSQLNGANGSYTGPDDVNIVAWLVLFNVIFVAMNESPLHAVSWAGDWITETIRLTFNAHVAIVRALFQYSYSFIDRVLILAQPPGLHEFLPNLNNFVSSIRMSISTYKDLLLDVVDWLGVPIFHFPTHSQLFDYLVDSAPSYDHFVAECWKVPDPQRCLDDLADTIKEAESRRAFKRMFHHELAAAEMRAIADLLGKVLEKQYNEKFVFSSFASAHAAQGMFDSILNFVYSVPDILSNLFTFERRVSQPLPSHESSSFWSQVKEFLSELLPHNGALVNSKFARSSLLSRFPVFDELVSMFRNISSTVTSRASSYVWHISARAWASIMHAMNGNTKTGAKAAAKAKLIAIGKSAQQAYVDNKADVIAASAQRWKKMVGTKLEDYGKTLGFANMAPPDMVRALRVNFMSELSDFPARFRNMYIPKVDKVTTAIVKQVFRVDNGRWVCRACNRDDCCYDPYFHCGSKPLPVPTRGAPAFPYAPGTNPNLPGVDPPVPLAMPNKPASSSFGGLPAPNVASPVVMSPSTVPPVVPPGNAVFQDLSVPINPMELLRSFLACESSTAIRDCVGYTPYDSSEVVIARVASLIWDLRKKAEIESTLAECNLDAVSLINKSTNQPYCGPPLPRVTSFTVDASDVFLDSSNTEFEKGLMASYASQALLYSSKTPCLYCHTLHPQLCLPFLRAKRNEPWASNPRFEGLLKKHGAIELYKQHSEDFRRFSAWVPLSSRLNWWYSHLTRRTDWISDRPVWATVSPTGRRKNFTSERVDEDLDRSLDPAFHRNPEIFEVEITRERFGISTSSFCWISHALLLEFSGRTNSTLGRLGDTDAFFAQLERINRTADNVRIPQRLNIRYPTLIADTMLAAAYLQWSRIDQVGWSVNRRGDHSGPSSTGLAGRRGGTCLLIGRLILGFVCSYVVAVLFVVVMGVLLPSFLSPLASGSTALTEQSLDPRSTIELRPVEGLSIEQEVSRLEQIFNRSRG